MIRKRLVSTMVWIGLGLLLLAGCTPREPEKKKPGVGACVRLSDTELGDIADDLDAASLRAAIERSLSFYGKEPAGRTYPLGDMEVSVERLKGTLTRFLELLDAGKTDRASLASTFDFYRVETEGAGAFVTGYYEPLLQGSVEGSPEFCYPIYNIPPDLVTVDLERFDPTRFSGQKLVGRLDGRRLVPYYTRAEIDGGRVLEPLRSELVYLRDPLDAFFLHVQGSGKIALAGGKSMRVGYAASNGRAYRSIGKVLIDRGVMKREEVTLQSIRSVLGAHPEMMDDVLFQNESYVFFRAVQDGPVGSLNVLLTAGRSVAMDPKMQPRGALVFLKSEKPRIDPNGECTGWEPLTRWVLNQDTGGAIKGIGRLDLFCGSGKAAEAVAGRMKHPGTLSFPLLREGAGGS